MRRLIDRLADDDGSTTPANMVWALILLAMVGLAIDTAQAYRVRSMLQHAVDAAGLAAARDLPDTDRATKTARTYIAANLPRAGGGHVADTATLRFGNWDAGSASFVPAVTDDPATRQDTVEITLSRSAANGNPVGTFLLRLFGHRSWDVHARSVAQNFGVCEDVLANDRISINSDVSLRSDLCLYARDGVTLALQPMAEDGTRIGMLDLENFSADEFALIPSGTLFEADLTPQRALALDEVIDEWRLQGVALAHEVQVVGELPNILQPGTAYLVEGDLQVEGEYVASDVIIAVRGNVTLRPAAAIRNTDDCRGGRSIGLYATGDVSIMRESVVSGLDIVAAGDVVVDQDLGAFSASVEAGDDILMMADPKITPCRPLWSVGGQLARLLL